MRTIVREWTQSRGRLRSEERMANEESGGQRGDIGRAHESCGGGGGWLLSRGRYI